MTEFAWLSTLKGDLPGNSRTERNYREDGKLSCPDAGQPGSTLLSVCRWRACLMVPCSEANTPSCLIGPFHSLSCRGYVIGCYYLLLRIFLSLRVGGVSNLLGLGMRLRPDTCLGRCSFTQKLTHSLTHNQNKTYSRRR